MFRLPLLSSGYELKLEQITLAVIWELFGVEGDLAQGVIEIDEPQMELAKRIAEKVMVVLDDFTD